MTPKINLNLGTTRRLLRRRAPIVVLLTVIVAGIALTLSEVATKKYTATTSLLFNNTNVNQQIAGLSPNYNPDAQAQQDTNLQLVQIGDMAATTAASLGGSWTRSDVTDALSFSAVGNTNIVEVSATSASPAVAARLANTYSAVFVHEQESSSQQYYAAALADVTKEIASLSASERTGSAGLSLETRAQTLGLLADIQSGSVQIAQRATIPTSPSSPRKKRNVAIGILLGLILGLGFAYLLERLDHRIRNEDELAAIFDLPLLGAVPQSSVLARGRLAEGGAFKLSGHTETESFNLIRAHLRYFNVDRELKTLLVTSAQASDGKTTVACHLAATAAKSGSNVLLIEADLRKPTMERQFGLQPAAGLSQVLIGTASLDEVIETIELELEAGLPPRSLDVLLAGAVPPNPAELVESQALRSLLSDARSRYDVVILDTPPITVVSDAFPLLLAVDGVILVGRIGTDRRRALRAHDILSEVHPPLLGVIVNGVTASAGAYGYYEYAPVRQPA